MKQSFSFNRRQFARMLGASAVAGAGLVRAQDARIVLGQSAAFSGPSMQLGKQFHAGVQLFFQ